MAAWTETKPTNYCRLTSTLMGKLCLPKKDLEPKKRKRSKKKSYLRFPRQIKVTWTSNFCRLGGLNPKTRHCRWTINGKIWDSSRLNLHWRYSFRHLQIASLQSQRMFENFQAMQAKLSKCNENWRSKAKFLISLKLGQKFSPGNDPGALPNKQPQTKITSNFGPKTFPNYLTKFSSNLLFFEGIIPTAGNLLKKELSDNKSKWNLKTSSGLDESPNLENRFSIFFLNNNNRVFLVRESSVAGGFVISFTAQGKNIHSQVLPVTLIIRILMIYGLFMTCVFCIVFTWNLCSLASVASTQPSEVDYMDS